MTTKLAHPPLDGISRVRFAPTGGNNLVVSSWDAHVRLYDVSSGAVVGVQRQSLAVLDCAFARDASRAVSGGLGKQVLAWDFQAQQEVLLGAHDEAIRRVEYHADTQQVITGSWDRTVRSWDPRCVPSATCVVKLGVKAFALDVSVDKVVVGGADRCIYIYDLRRLGTLLDRRESSLKYQLRAVRVASDGKSYASSSVEGRVAIEYFDADENQRSRYAFKCHRTKEANGSEVVHPVNALAFHPEYGTFATGGSDGGVCVWDAEAKKRLWRLSPFDTAVSSVAFAADGSKLCVGVSHTFDDGVPKPDAPAPVLAIRQLADAEVRPKGLAKKDGC
eukprot:gnl/TRDRNA2_/TRDRNA2_185086_c0_seq1.p1 gnl/TRDRNA2_/TRDRNA2_185086_c0~~gnl/TRDRNA2_/TRDRNA2_185086_c0_seq1.p1  ORF type:complete len:333 (+),score=58.34 gnl/TRDRNA2_/TRDRNA2_185086_c0_seq1:107-1105(+)